MLPYFVVLSSLYLTLPVGRLLTFLACTMYSLIISLPLLPKALVITLCFSDCFPKGSFENSKLLFPMRMLDGLQGILVKDAVSAQLSTCKLHVFHAEL
eukprot:1158984-Pelagomonas_calceolata.AAC.9